MAVPFAEQFMCSFKVFILLKNNVKYLNQLGKCSGLFCALIYFKDIFQGKTAKWCFYNSFDCASGLSYSPELSKLPADFFLLSGHLIRWDEVFADRPTSQVWKCREELVPHCHAIHRRREEGKRLEGRRICFTGVEHDVLRMSPLYVAQKHNLPRVWGGQRQYKPHPDLSWACCACPLQPSVFCITLFHLYAAGMFLFIKIHCWKNLLEHQAENSASVNV